MTDLPDDWESLEGEFISSDLHGEFYHAWGTPVGGEYDVIIAVYVHDMTKYGNGIVYKIENPVKGKTVIDKLKQLVSDDNVSKPVLSTQEKSSKTTVHKTDVSVSNSEEALEKAVEVMDD